MSAVEDTTTRTTSSGPGRRRIWHLLARITPALMLFVVQPGKEAGCDPERQPAIQPAILQQAVPAGRFLELVSATPDGNGNTTVVYRGSNVSAIFEADDAAGINCHANAFTQTSPLCAGAGGYRPLSTTVGPPGSYLPGTYTTKLKSKSHFVVCTGIDSSFSNCEELKLQ